jgi:acetyl-CoA carboxylase biotin carboxyl carrier protein
MRNQKNKESDSLVSMDWQELERLLEFMEEHGLEEFEYSRGDFRVRLRKPGSGMMLHPGTTPISSEGQRNGQAERAQRRGAVDNDADDGTIEGVQPEAGRNTSKEDQINGQLVKSPIVGTYYEAPNPGASAFVKLGDHVSAGQVICIVEAMKLMNEIESDASGKVTKIFMQNGQPVEYGQPLFAIQPANQA